MNEKCEWLNPEHRCFLCGEPSTLIEKDGTDGLAPMWPDRRTEEQLKRDGPTWKHFSCPDPWYLIDISEEEYQEWLDTELVYQGDFGNLGFTHAIGINREYMWRGFH